MEIRLFGHADVSSSGVPIKFAKRSTTLAMIAYLVLRRGQSMSRESLAFVLFPESDETAALAELRRYLYLAAKALPERNGEPWIVADAETVRWNEGDDAFVDVLAFERLAADPETHLEAIELYAGDLLEDVYDDWVLGERERLRARYLTILTASIVRLRGQRAFGPAIELATRLLASDPWREDALRSLVAIRYESGDTAGALAEYDRFAKRLRDDLDIAPMAETVAVRRSILRDEAVPGSFDRALGTSAANTAPARAVLPFVGRNLELETLRAAWSRAARGAPSFVLVGGEAGVGKTRLTGELARIAQAEGGRVFVGTTSSPESGPYQAIVEALRSALPLVLARPPSAARRAVLARLIPEVGDVDSDDRESAGGWADVEAARVYDALTYAVRGLASPRPLLFVLEDLHWAGAASLDALGAIVRALARTPVLVIATCRDEETPPGHPLRSLARSLRATVSADEIALERLAETDVADLVARIDGLRDRSAEIAGDLFAQSEGNALFLSEAIGLALESAPHAAGSRDTTVARLIASRVARLDESARAVAEIAAVAGSGASVALVRDVSNLPAAAVARGFDELLDRRLMREAGARTNDDYVFTHHLIADAIYAEIDPVFRTQRHARIARVLEAHRAAGRGSSREIARHHERGGNAERSAHWYLTAARESAAVHAYGDAIELASRALAAEPATNARRALLDVREKAFGKRAERDAQRKDIDALAELAELSRLAGGDARDTFDVLVRRVLFARALGESVEEGRYIDEMQAVAAELDDEERAQALVQRATHAGLRSRHSEGLEPARTALAIYERLGDLGGQLECLYLLVDFTTNAGDLEASRDVLAEMSRRAASVRDRAVEARALTSVANAALLQQGYRECFDLSTRALAIHLETGDREAEAAARGRLSATAARLDDFGTALRECDATLALYESMGQKRGLGVTHTNRATLLLRLGLFDEALFSIERSNALFETAREQRTTVANRVNASLVKLHLGEPREAKALAESALGDARQIGFPVFEAAALANLGNAERELGEYDAAIEHMLAGIDLRRRVQAPQDFADDLADLTRAYVEAGRPSDAVDVANELRAIGARSFDGAVWPHYVWWAMAMAYEAAGAADDARAASATAKSELERFARKIEDHRIREMFLALAINRRIVAGR